MRPNSNDGNDLPFQKIKLAQNGCSFGKKEPTPLGVSTWMDACNRVQKVLRRFICCTSTTDLGAYRNITLQACQQHMSKSYTWKMFLYPPSFVEGASEGYHFQTNPAYFGGFILVLEIRSHLSECPIRGFI